MTEVGINHGSSAITSKLQYQWFQNFSDHQQLEKLIKLSTVNALSNQKSLSWPILLEDSTPLKAPDFFQTCL